MAHPDPNVSNNGSRAMTENLSAQVARAQSGRGTERMTYLQFLEFQDEARREQCVICNVEGFEIEGDCTQLRMDATWTFADWRIRTDWRERVSNSISFANEVLSSVPDKSSLQYVVWLSPIPVD